MKLTNRLLAMIGCLAFVAAAAGHARAKSTGGYVQTNLISDIPGLAEVHDPTLLNPWGLAFFPDASPFWINENNAGFSALYFADAVPFPSLPRVIIPPPPPSTSPGTPTGIVANFFCREACIRDPQPADSTKPFGPALFIFDTEDGTIEAWNSPPFVSPGITDPLIAVIVVDNSQGGAPTGAVYKGLALGSNAANGPLLYATNFPHREGRRLRHQLSSAVAGA